MNGIQYFTFGYAFTPANDMPVCGILFDQGGAFILGKLIRPQNALSRAVEVGIALQMQFVTHHVGNGQADGRRGG